MLLENKNLNIRPHKNLDSSEVFGTKKKIMVPFFSEKSDLVPEIEVKDLSVYYGGPVHSANLFYLHQLGDLIENSVKICDNIWTSGDFNQIIEFINMGIIDTRKIKFFLGYAGWTENQLTNEFKSNSWIALNLLDDDIFSENKIDLWKDVLNKRGGRMKAISNFPLNPIDN